MTTIRSEQVWDDLRRPLWRLLRSRLGDDATADDLVQEVFVRVVSGLSGLQDAQRLRAWVYRIARNVLTDYYRRADAAPVSLAGSGQWWIACPTATERRSGSPNWKG